MRFSHMADIHLGGWREPALEEMNREAFVKAIDISLEKNADFVLISGDLFNTSVPGVDVLKMAVTQLKRLKQRSIPVYAIAGSHDFSPSGKTMLEVLEEAELLRNVCRGDVEEGKLKLEFTVDKKTGAKITGILGKKGMLDRTYYENLDVDPLEQETGFKIFMFHTAIEELKTEDLEKMEAAPLSLLPKGFDYYAGGHVHIVRNERIAGYKEIVYPGPTFPNSFTELEKLGHGGFYFYDSGKAEYIPIKLAGVELIEQDCGNKTPAQATEQLLEKINARDMSGVIALLRIYGILETGKLVDLNLKEIINLIESKGARCVLKNTAKLSTKEFQEVKVKADTPEQTEQIVIKEHLGQSKLDAPEEENTIASMMRTLDTEKRDGEKMADYEKRVSEEARRIFNL